MFLLGAELGAEQEGMTEEQARSVVEAMLESEALFVLSMREAIREDPALIEDLLIIWQIPELCVGVANTPLTSAGLEEYADRYAGGPGAIYFGDLNQLAGPAVFDEHMWNYGTDLGDDNGNIPLYALQQHRWIFESQYYQALLEKARLTNPTELVSTGERITLQHTCINSQLLWCKHLQTYFAPNVEKRTNGQVIINITSFPELGGRYRHRQPAGRSAP